MGVSWSTKVFFLVDTWTVSPMSRMVSFASFGIDICKALSQIYQVGAMPQPSISWE